MGAVRPEHLWLDRVDSYSRPDLWLGLRTDDLDAATSRLAAAGIVHLLAEHSEPSAHPAGEGRGSSPE